MDDINIILLCLSTVLSNTNRHHLQLISYALLAMNGRVTMLGLSRWAEKGGSYRTIQRFLGQPLSWCRWNGYLVRHQWHDEVVLIAGDTTMVTKSGQKTHRLGRYFASIYNRAVPGLLVFTLSLISVKQRRAFPMITEQVLQEADEPTLTKVASSP
ncbi:MAG: transposase [Thioploca sp.]|nr:transposase [Thioploca sp.]